MFETNPVITQAARKDDPVPPDAIEGWVFKDREAEGEYIARFIASAARP